VSERTCSKWVARYRCEGEPGLRDRSSAPVTVANRTDARRVEAIAFYARHGVIVERVMTDNGPPYLNHLLGTYI
jgi:hypothetical protein